MSLNRGFYEYELKWYIPQLDRNRTRAEIARKLLKEFPFRDDPKSRALRVELQAWIELDERQSPVIEEFLEKAVKNIVECLNQEDLERES